MRMYSKAYLITGLKALENGRGDAAEYYLLKSLEHEPDSAHYALLGWFYGKNGTVRDALRCFRKAIRLSPEKSYLYNDFGAILLDSGHLRPAVRWLLRSLRCADHSSRFASYYNLALIYRIWNRPERSLRYLNLSLNASPGFIPARQLLEELHIANA